MAFHISEDMKKFVESFSRRPSQPQSESASQPAVVAMPPPVPKKLHYKIHDASSSTDNYPPRKILQNRPTDPGSRWSSDTNSHPQYLTLKLIATSIVHQLTFGKYEKMHVCNVRKFQICGGLEESSMVLLYEGDLRNDSIPETFNLKTMVGGKSFPINYIKIIPTQTWGSSFNYSIWYVELTGTDDETTVSPVLHTMASFRQETAFRVCLKMFRDLGLDECFETLQRNVPSVSLEHPFVTNLYDTVVKRGAFEEAESLIDTAAADGMLTKTAGPGRQPVPVWTEICAGSGASPGMRGGHQMVIDSGSQMIYLFGGWDGARDLADFWQYDLLKKQWILISTDTEQEDGPSARSCHKMVLDADNQTIFVMGRFIDGAGRSAELKNDFYMYDILRKRWTQLSADTYSEGGPKVLFDHQMALDALKKTIYVFGGRIAEKKPAATVSSSGSSIDRHYPDSTSISGMYAYHIPTSTWRRIQTESIGPNRAVLKPRMGHCIIFHPVRRLLYIFGGKYDKDPVKDMVAFHVDKETLHTVGSTSSGDAMPVGLTQRATLDLDKDEIYVYFGLKATDTEFQQNTLWIFDFASGKWNVCPSLKNNSSGDSSSPSEPSPRYAHQIAYDPLTKFHYLFGGNPSVPNSGSAKTRLDDFWQMKLVQLRGADVPRQAKYVIRKQKFRELCLDDPLAAVQYLQRDVFEMVDPQVATEMNEFHDLPTQLFADCGSRKRQEQQSGSKALTTHQCRVDVFSKLCNFFPDEMAPPRSNLIDLVLP